MTLASPADVPSTPWIVLGTGWEQACAGFRFVRNVVVCLTWRAALTNSPKRNNWNYMLRVFWFALLGWCMCENQP